MKTFTATELKNKLGDVLNEVQKNGNALIKSKSRPDFIILEFEEYQRKKNATHTKKGKLS